MFKRQKSARRRNASSQSGRSLVEGLESRRLMHSPTITAVSADNRGEVLITFDQAAWAELNPALANKNSVQMYEAGANGHLGDGDDVRVAASIRYTAGNGRLLVRGDIPAGNGYRVKVVGSRFTTFQNDQLDGDFNGTLPSGNGVAGGNFEFQVKNIKTSTPTVRMSTSAGTINIKLRGDLVGPTVNNFLRYANGKQYDNTFFHRSGRTEPSPIDIIQGGGYSDLVNGTHIPTSAPIALDAGKILNTRGTISMARTSAPDSATSEFFFNIQDNAFLDPSGPGTGYAAFGNITAGQAAADAIFAAPTTARGSFANVPQVSSADVSLRRVAVVSKVAAL